MNWVQIESGIGTLIIVVGSIFVGKGWATQDQVAGVASAVTTEVIPGIIVLVIAARKIYQASMNARIAQVNNSGIVKVVHVDEPAPKVNSIQEAKAMS